MHVGSVSFNGCYTYRNALVREGTFIVRVRGREARLSRGRIWLMKLWRSSIAKRVSWCGVLMCICEVNGSCGDVQGTTWGGFVQFLRGGVDWLIELYGGSQV